MKLRKAIKLAAAGAAVSLLPGIAAAAGVPALNAWTLDTATQQINYDQVCNNPTSDFVCSAVPISDNGFYQTTLKNTGTNEEYIVTIIADSDAAGTASFGALGNNGFADANAIMIKNTDGNPNDLGGILSQSEQVELQGGAAGEDDYSATTQLAKGYAIAPDGQGNPSTPLGVVSINGVDEIVEVILGQNVADTTGPQTFANNFGYNGGAIAASPGVTFGQSTVSGTTTDIDSGFDSTFDFQSLKIFGDTALALTTDTKRLAVTAVLADATIDQTFSMKELSGNLVTGGGTVWTPIGPTPTVWNAGDGLKETNIAQTGDSGTFGFTDALNVSTQSRQKTFSFIETGPFFSFDPNPF